MLQLIQHAFGNMATVHAVPQYLSFDEWLVQYKPRDNRGATRNHADFDLSEKMYDTFDADFDVVRKHRQKMTDEWRKVFLRRSAIACFSPLVTLLGC